MVMPAEGTAGRWILVVEDSESGAAMLEMALAPIPRVSVLLAASGLDALRILENPATPIGAVVTDLNMPRMDGFELIRRIRADGRLSGTPIVVVTADADPSTPERAARLGADAVFPKPYSPSTLRRKLEQLLDEAQF
jgi:CheY-like chemotaxis protein